MGVGGVVCRADFVGASAQTHEGGIDLTLFPLGGDDPEELIDILDRLEVITAISRQVHDLHDAPILQLFEAIAHVRPRHSELVADLLGMKGVVGDKEEGVNLGDGSIDAPLGPHLTPMEDEVLRKEWKIFHFEYFCLYRNIETKACKGNFRDFWRRFPGDWGNRCEPGEGRVIRPGGPLPQFASFAVFASIGTVFSRTLGLASEMFTGLPVLPMAIRSSRMRMVSRS